LPGAKGGGILFTVRGDSLPSRQAGRSSSAQLFRVDADVSEGDRPMSLDIRSHMPSAADIPAEAELETGRWAETILLVLGAIITVALVSVFSVLLHLS
jgi:hypothetical protein